MSDEAREVTPELVANVLAASREFIERNGWTQGEFVVREWDGQSDNPDDWDANWDVLGYCAVGGMLYSQQVEEERATTDPLIQQTMLALADALGLVDHHKDECKHKAFINSERRCTCVINQITAWNDYEERTAQEVLDAFAKAEKITRAGYDPDA